MCIMVDDHLHNSNPDPNTLKELRTRLGWTQIQMAEALGVTERTIQRVERGEYELNLKIWQIKKFLSLLSQAEMSIDNLPDSPG